MLTQARLKKLLDYNPLTGVFVWKVQASNRVSVGDVAGCRDAGKYWVIEVDKTLYKAHRLARLYMTGKMPREQVDHINGVRSDNRFTNLREASHKENQHNARKRADNTSGHKGVSWHAASGKWRADIRVDGIGFAHVEDAAAAYAEASARLHKSFGRLA